MATLILGGLGAMAGGPFGGAIGALVGRQLDGAILGTPKRDGPRLKELAVSTSSYGQPIGRQFGRVRAAGTVIWATDLKETSETSGGKGKPKTTEYAYSVSFAVALSSRPIDSVGRIWADGNLLRGASGELKSGGTLRVYRGHANQPLDPLLAAALGRECPAHRGCAYVVFEDLQLADFGNRIPALSFEIFAGPGAALVDGLIEDLPDATGFGNLAGIEGFTHEGGTHAQVLALIDRLEPIDPIVSGKTLGLERSRSSVAPVADLPDPAVWSDGDFGREDGVARARRPQGARALSALRYYDPARDYQPGLQRADTGGETMEFPGVVTAGAARSLLHDAAARERIAQETVSWRMAELDPALQPGRKVRVPGLAGQWKVASWEWREGGIELQLVRNLELAPPAIPASPGGGWLPHDRDPQPTRLRAFELPWDGSGSPGAVHAYVAASAPAGPWSGAALYAAQDGGLLPIGDVGSAAAIGGALSAPLPGGQSFRFSAAADLHLSLDNADAELHGATPEAIARGSNRLLVGREILQFATAEPQGQGLWRLSGLLRGRAGTEDAALAGHAAGTAVTLLDARLTDLADAQLAQADEGMLAAIGIGDRDPAYAVLENVGASRRPPFPCHARCMIAADGSLVLSWTRRARGGWAWLDDVEQPLVEQTETYELGVGPLATPILVRTVGENRAVLDAATVASLAATERAAAIWVRQRGTYARSKALLLGTLPSPS
ncbi:phage tail protein [Qipengyuania sp. 6B39]|uniref:phage tail protein n=1 Tax=Qipengyuania proteolytica TaxID=2867239 RepID=UPI001C8B0418|nr:phage tail protein [Qipengyuania proteolytica]MBX7494454.1 phage tail protein [Qipengyuania proteolytica]